MHRVGLGVAAPYLSWENAPDHHPELTSVKNSSDCQIDAGVSLSRKLLTRPKCSEQAIIRFWSCRACTLYKTFQEKSTKLLKRPALALSRLLSHGKPLGNFLLLIGAGPNLFAHTALECVEQGGVVSTRSNSCSFSIQYACSSSLDKSCSESLSKSTSSI